VKIPLIMQGGVMLMKYCNFIRISILFILILSNFNQAQSQGNLKKALVLLPQNYGANYFLLMKMFEEYGFDVTTTGVYNNAYPCNSFAGPLGCPTLQIDIPLNDITDLSGYDCLFLPSASKWQANTYSDILNSPSAMNLISDADEAGLLIITFCRGAMVLANAGVLNGHSITGDETYRALYNSSGAVYLGQPIPPHLDENILTSTRNNYYLLEIGDVACDALDNLFSTAIPTGGEINSTDVTFSWEPSIEWAKTIGGMSADGARSIIEGVDGGFIFAGYTFSSGNGNADILLTKLNDEGDIVWSKTFGGVHNEYAYSVCKTSGNNYFITGFTNSTGSGGRDIILIKTDAEGNMIWEKYYGGEGFDVGNSIVQTGDGYILLAGNYTLPGRNDYDAYLAKINLDGDIIWEKTFGTTGNDWGNSVIETSDGHYLVSGTTNTEGASVIGDTDSRQFYLTKLNTNGEILWEKNYGNLNGDHEFGLSICELMNGEYVIAGFGDRLFNDLYNVNFVKTSVDGNQMKSSKLGEGSFYDFGNTVISTDDGGFIICGETENTQQVSGDMYFLKFNSDGNYEWKEIIGGMGNEAAHSIIQLADGSYAAAGHTDSYGNGSYDAFVVKINKNATGVSIEELPEGFYMSNNFPNPFNPETQILYSIPEAGNVKICIYDINGEMIRNLVDDYKSTGQHKAIWNGKDDSGNIVSSAAYFYTLQSGKYSITRKMLFLK